jgi:histidinol-phosphate aminotransferase
MAEPKRYILDLNPYQPSIPLSQVAKQFSLDPAAIVQLASNENPLGPSPKVIKAVNAALKDVSRYPDQHDLVNAVVKFYKILPEQVAIGNGSNDILDMIARVYLGEGDEAVSSQYSFAIYKIATRTAGAANIIAQTKPDFNLDLNAMAAAITPNTKVIWLDNPGNPTGAFTPYSEIRQFLETIPKNIKVVLDEAYYEYLPDQERKNALEWLADFPDLIITRTFSKMYGLAGMRVGYAVASPRIIELMNRVRHPFNVNIPALIAAETALCDQGFVRRSRHLNTAGREMLTSAFDLHGLDYIQPYGNFVALRLPNASDVYQQLLTKGVIVRPLAGYGMGDYLRVTIGTKLENQRFIDVLTEILS